MSGAPAPQARVSVVISCFNYVRFVAPAVASALDQRGCEVEVVVVDDGSSDGSVEALGTFGDRIRVLEKPNEGQGSALSAGYAASRGDVLIFLDADDLLLEGAALSSARALSDTSVSKAHWSMPVVDAEGDPTGELLDPDLVEGDLRRHVAAEGPLSERVLPSPPMSGNAFSRWFLDRVMPVPALYRLRADDYLSGLAPAFGAIVRLAPQSLYRMHGANLHLAQDFEQIYGFEQSHYELVARIVAETYARDGVPHELSAWDRFSWAKRLARTVRAITEAVPAGERLALIDEGLLGVTGELSGRGVIAFGERDGEWGGSPVSDEAALAELERLRAASVRYIALAWPAFWWLEEYPRLAAALGDCRRLPVGEDAVLIFGPADA
ncbi:MAG: hypothetical protein QOK19_288 [Solirubrobacteraceae bacterium]|jgi:hypothetical protein|nr:glycosyl transferase family 2 [Solirubrobacterales bacterium]MEA2214727.1 hypothetical protein [Solirubrobacteraceae bacterium]